MTMQYDDFGIVISELVIFSADVNDTGSYQCKAVTLIAEYLPSPISDEAIVLVQGILQGCSQ